MVTTTKLIEITQVAADNFSDDGFQGQVIQVDPSFPTRGGPSGMG